MIEYQAPVVFVQDIQVSRRFYENLLGQKVAMDHGPNVAFDGGFAIWQADHVRLLVFDDASDLPNPIGCHNMELYFESENLGEVLDSLVEAGVSLVHPLREQPWGQRVIRVYDPDRHIVEIGEPVPTVIRRFLGQGMNVQDVAQRTSMPLNLVELLAGEG